MVTWSSSGWKPWSLIRRTWKVASIRSARSSGEASQQVGTSRIVTTRHWPGETGAGAWRIRTRRSARRIRRGSGQRNGQPGGYPGARAAFGAGVGPWLLPTPTRSPVPDGEGAGHERPSSQAGFPAHFRELQGPDRDGWNPVRSPTGELASLEHQGPGSRRSAPQATSHRSLARFEASPQRSEPRSRHEAGHP